MSTHRRLQKELREALKLPWLEAIMPEQGDRSIEKLVAQLAASETDEAEGAQYGLQAYGIEALPAVLNALSTLPAFGQLWAIEIIEACDADQLRSLNQPSVARVLVPLLESDNDVVREWVARTVGWLGALSYEHAPVALRMTYKFAAAHPRRNTVQISRPWMRHGYTDRPVHGPSCLAHVQQIRLRGA